MSRIIDVVNKIMQISGEMNTLRSCQLQREKMFRFRNLQLVIYGKAKGRGR